MLVFARDVFLCRCPTTVPPTTPAEGDAARLRIRSGGAADFERLDPAFHPPEHVADLRARLASGEYWLVGDLDDRLVTYTWLHARPLIDYPSLPGCAFHVGPDTAYGHDAWTHPDLRSQGIRRVAFAEELRILAGWGKTWEASFFVQRQLEGATRSLAKAGITVEPLWRIKAHPRGLTAERLLDDGATRPAFELVTP